MSGKVSVDFKRFLNCPMGACSTCPHVQRCNDVRSHVERGLLSSGTKDTERSDRPCQKPGIPVDFELRIWFNAAAMLLLVLMCCFNSTVLPPAVDFFLITWNFNLSF